MTFSCLGRVVLAGWMMAILNLSSTSSTMDGTSFKLWGQKYPDSRKYPSDHVQPLAFTAAPSALPVLLRSASSTCFRRLPFRCSPESLDCAASNPDLRGSTNRIDSKAVLATVESNPQPKRKRGIGKNLVVTPRSERAESPAKVNTKQSAAYLSKQATGEPAAATSAPRKRRGRGIGKPVVAELGVIPEDLEITAPFSEESEASVDEELEQEWKEQVGRVGSLRPPESTARPAGSRLRSRLRTRQPQKSRPRGSSEGRQGLGPAIRTHQDFEFREMMRRTSIVTKGPNASSSLDLFVNPGFLERRNKANERSAAMDSRAGSVSLLDLKRLGLVDPAVSAQQIRRGNDAVVKEIDVGMAIFDMQVIGDRVFSAGSDDHITIWNATTWEQLGEMNGHTAWVNALLVDEEQNMLFSGSDDGTVRAWDLDSLECVHVLKGHTKGALSLSAHRGYMYVGCEGKIVVWDMKDWHIKTKLLNHTHVLRAMSGGQQMSKNRPLAPLAAVAREPAKLFGHKVCGIQAFGPFMLSAVDDGTVWVWNTKNMEVERKLLGPSLPNTWVRPVVIAELHDARRRDSRTKLVSGWADGAIRVYDLRTWTLEHTLRAHNGPILSLSQADGKFISTGADMAANVWNSDSWTVEQSLRGHKGAVCAACEVNGKLVTASLDGLIKVWASD